MSEHTFKVVERPYFKNSRIVAAAPFIDDQNVGEIPLVAWKKHPEIQTLMKAAFEAGYRKAMREVAKVANSHNVHMTFTETQ